MTRHDDAGAAEGIPSDESLEAARNRVESVLADHDLALDDPALWLEPVAALSHDLVSAQAPPPARRRMPRWAPWLAAAAVIVAVLGVTLLTVPNQPDWTVELGATEAYPTAAATIDGWNEGSGTRMLLTMEGVDPAPAGFFYEMWMSEGPVHISAGTFSEIADIELRAAVARRDYPRLWVTLEPIDDDESPTRVVVIDTGP
ncbi:MAG TPA: anti-sigma factor [Acidimicrobiia bacterium]|nr:anti-sigma factor [Acidimicrobiia bacterium]